MHHPTDRIAQTAAFVTPVVEHRLEREIGFWKQSINVQLWMLCFVYHYVVNVLLIYSCVCYPVVNIPIIYSCVCHPVVNILIYSCVCHPVVNILIIYSCVCPPVVNINNIQFNMPSYSNHINIQLCMSSCSIHINIQLWMLSCSKHINNYSCVCYPVVNISIIYSCV